MDPLRLPAPALEFIAERHLATLTTVRADGSPHVIPVGFTFDGSTAVARVITFAGAVKVSTAAAGRRAALCQVDGGRWLTLEGTTRVRSEPDVVAAAVAAYAARYRQPKERPDRVVVELVVDRVMGSRRLQA